MRTKLGDFLRRIRINEGHILKDMSDILGVSSAFLSAVENGKKSMPKTWVNKLKESYNLSDIKCDEMLQLSMESQDQVAINIKNESYSNKELAVSFARQFKNINEETSQKILELLKSHKEDN